MTGIKPWAVGPFEMLYHAETHFLKGEDFDRRIALISFDSAITTIYWKDYTNAHEADMSVNRQAEMNYNGSEKWLQEELFLDYALGCKYVVCADISTFFPSVYAHSIPWAVKGKKWAKIHRCNSWKTRNGNYRHNNNQPCLHNDDELWPNDLDTISRSIKDLHLSTHTLNMHSACHGKTTILRH